MRYRLRPVIPIGKGESAGTGSLVTLLASVQFVMIGILGEYVGRICEQVKRRRLYVVREIIDVDARADDARTRNGGDA